MKMLQIELLTPYCVRLANAAAAAGARRIISADSLRHLLSPLYGCCSDEICSTGLPATTVRLDVHVTVVKKNSEQPISAI